MPRKTVLVTPWKWLGSAVRISGHERREVVQAAKAALAATVAWLLATAVLGLPQPFLAPYAAVFLVQSTVYRSVLGWAQQVGSVTLGVLLAALAAWWIPSVTLGLGVAVFTGLLIGGWRRLGEAGPWVGITAMLLVSYGTAGQDMLLVDRLVETALGAAVGTLVNMVLLPPVYGARTGAAVDRLAVALGDLLELVGDTLRSDEPAERFDEVGALRRDSHSLFRAAEDAMGWDREARWLNLRGRFRRSRGVHDRYEQPFVTLVAVESQMAPLADGLHAVSVGGGSFRFPPPEAVDSLAELLGLLADAVRAKGKPGQPVDLERCRQKLSSLERRLSEPDSAAARTVGLAAMVLPAQRVLEALEAR